MMGALEWLEREIRFRFDLRTLSKEQEIEIRWRLSDEWSAANWLRILEDLRKQDTRHYFNPTAVVYFARADGAEEIKIGTSTQLARRIRALEVSSRSKITVLATVVGSYKVEAWIQDRFRRARVRGEWFRPVPELLEYIAEIQSGEPPKDLSRYFIEALP
jgi:hypothetical protein